MGEFEHKLNNVRNILAKGGDIDKYAKSKSGRKFLRSNPEIQKEFAKSNAGWEGMYNIWHPNMFSDYGNGEEFIPDMRYQSQVVIPSKQDDENKRDYAKRLTNDVFQGKFYPREALELAREDHAGAAFRKEFKNRYKETQENIYTNTADKLSNKVDRFISNTRNDELYRNGAKLAMLLASSPFALSGMAGNVAKDLASSRMFGSALLEPGKFALDLGLGILGGEAVNKLVSNTTDYESFGPWAASKFGLDPNSGWSTAFDLLNPGYWYAGRIAKPINKLWGKIGDEIYLRNMNKAIKASESANPNYNNTRDIVKAITSGPNENIVRKNWFAADAIRPNDLKTPINYSDPNIYRTMAGLAVGTGLYDAYNDNNKDNDISEANIAGDALKIFSKLFADDFGKLSYDGLKNAWSKFSKFYNRKLYPIIRTNKWHDERASKIDDIAKSGYDYYDNLIKKNIKKSGPLLGLKNKIVFDNPDLLQATSNIVPNSYYSSSMKGPTVRGDMAQIGHKNIDYIKRKRRKYNNAYEKKIAIVTDEDRALAKEFGEKKHQIITNSVDNDGLPITTISNKEANGDALSLIKPREEYKIKSSQRLSDVENIVGDDGIVMGSTRTYAETGLYGKPKDTEIFTTEERYKNNNYNAVNKKNDFTYTGVNKNLGDVDVNIIQEKNGNATGKLAHEIYRCIDPIAWHNMVDKSTSVFEKELPGISAEDLFSKLKNDKHLQRIVSLVNTLSASKGKMKKRTAELIYSEDSQLFKDLNECVNIIGKMNYGESYMPIEEEFPNLNFEDTEANKTFLDYLGIFDDGSIASNPEKMKFIFSKYRTEGIIRGVTERNGIDIENMFNINISAKSNNSYSGPGLNTLINTGLSKSGVTNSTHIGIAQRPFTSTENIYNLADFVSKEKRERITTEDLISGGIKLNDTEKGKIKNYLLNENTDILDVMLYDKNDFLDSLDSFGRISQFLKDFNEKYAPTSGVTDYQTQGFEFLSDKGMKMTSDLNSRIADILGIDGINTDGYDSAYYGNLKTDLPWSIAPIQDFPFETGGGFSQYQRLESIPDVFSSYKASYYPEIFLSQEERQRVKDIRDKVSKVCDKASETRSKRMSQAALSFNRKKFGFDEPFTTDNVFDRVYTKLSDELDELTRKNKKYRRRKREIMDAGSNLRWVLDSKAEHIKKEKLSFFTALGLISPFLLFSLGYHASKGRQDIKKQKNKRNKHNVKRLEERDRLKRDEDYRSIRKHDYSSGGMLDISGPDDHPVFLNTRHPNNYDISKFGGLSNNISFNHALNNVRKKLASQNNTQDSSQPEFIKRLENNEHPNVLLNNGDIATHLLSQVDNYAIPMVQPIDYSNTSLGYQVIPNGFDAARRAFGNNDTLRFNSDADAERYTEMYKNYYPNYFSNADFGSGYVGSARSPIQIQPITVTPNGNSANWYNYGGGIHIKPENVGKFTRLKERTGHSTSWFLNNGTPAQRKMANFARNAKKWKH